MLLCMFVSQMMFVHALSYFWVCVCSTFLWACVRGAYLCIFLGVFCVFTYIFLFNTSTHHSQHIYTLVNGKYAMHDLLHIYFPISFNSQLICYPATFATLYHPFGRPGFQLDVYCTPVKIFLGLRWHNPWPKFRRKLGHGAKTGQNQAATKFGTSRLYESPVCRLCHLKVVPL